jgi:hypothetical protein
VHEFFHYLHTVCGIGKNKGAGHAGYIVRNVEGVGVVLAEYYLRFFAGERAYALLFELAEQGAEFGRINLAGYGIEYFEFNLFEQCGLVLCFEGGVLQCAN